MKVKQLEYHRNGISGLGFWVGIVENDEEQNREMLVIRFPNVDKDGSVVCAAFDLEQLGKKEIRFGYNSFRGDHFNEVMDSAIKVANKAWISKEKEGL